MTTTKTQKERLEGIPLFDQEGKATREKVAFLVRRPTSRDRMNIRYRVREAGGRYVDPAELKAVARDGIRAIFAEQGEAEEGERIVSLVGDLEDLQEAQLTALVELPADASEEDVRASMEELETFNKENGPILRETYRVLETSYEPYRNRLADREVYDSLFQEAAIRELVLESEGLPGGEIKAGLTGLSLEEHDRIPAATRSFLATKLFQMISPDKEAEKNLSSPSSTG